MLQDLENYLGTLDQKIEVLTKKIDFLLAKPAKGEKELLTVDEAAGLLNVSKITLYLWTSKGKIPHVKIGKRLSFSRSELLDWVKNKR